MGWGKRERKGTGAAQSSHQMQRYRHDIREGVSGHRKFRYKSQGLPSPSPNCCVGEELFEYDTVVRDSCSHEPHESASTDLLGR